MSHTDLHSRTEKAAYNNSSTKVAASSYPKDVAKPTTPDETQNLEGEKRYRTWYKGSLTKSEIYERLYPDGTTGALRIDGPASSENGGFMTFKSDGAIVIRTGKKDTEKGAAAGKLCIHTDGQQQKHTSKSVIQYNKGTEDEALNVIAYGDVVEDAVGSERHIKAKKIIITAEEELMLIGGSQVFIQAGSSGKGTITMNAGNIEKTTKNEQEIITGQRITIGVSEDTVVNYDPRASVNIVSPGHLNHKILGDYSTWVGGIEEHIVAGGPGLPPLIKVRDSAFTVKTAIGGQTFDAADFINRKAGGAIGDVAGAAFTATAGADASISAGVSASLEAGVDASVKAGGVLSLTAIGNTNIKGLIINLN